MDKLDLKILQSLDWHGRMPINRIAKIVHSNKDVVAYRVNKLEKQEIITNYYPVIDMHKLGYHTSRLYFDLEELDDDETKDFIDFIDKKINAGLIFWHDYLPYTCGIFLWNKSVYEVEQAIFKIKRKLGKKLIKYNYSLISTFRQYPKDYLFGNPTHTEFRSLEPSKIINHDKNDFNILKLLSKNARISTMEISRKLKIPQTTVSKKIKSLEKNKIILGYRAQINITKLNQINYFLEIYLGSNKNIQDIESWANVNKHVVWLQKIIGTCDLEVEVEVKNKEELNKLLNSLRKKFKSIRKIVFWSQEYKKLTFLP
ncbi:hypothetical protein COV16_00715 [Candidatus Woesearchaeota archaeon CG10_big_fil_rev_8_21_14_0_10_34_8]|nr:MAG: hypothetical protein COV16_00715 [Candidatus Woesearchaeota archaeon CG10_big_fil_rev_8_21_14_0_10_34_8]